MFTFSGAGGAGGGDRPTSPFVEEGKSAEPLSPSSRPPVPAKFASLSVDTAPADDVPGREFKAGVMIVGRRIRGALKKKSTSGFRMFKVSSFGHACVDAPNSTVVALCDALQDKYFMLHNGKILQFDSEKQYMSGYIPTPDQTTYVNLYDLDSMDDDKKFTFRLVPKHVSDHTSKTIVFRSQDAEAKEIWVNALTAVPELVVMTPAMVRDRGAYDDSGSEG